MVPVLATTAIAYYALDSAFHVKDQVLELLGRDANLTDRAGLWELVRSLEVNPLIGAGFMSFWSGDRMQTIWDALGGGINQAHNGYLEQYLNLGYIGVGFIIAIIASALLNVRTHLKTDPSAAVLRLCFISVAILYNYTEASFYGINNMWVLLLIASIDVKGEPSGLREKPPAAHPAAGRLRHAVALAAAVAHMRRRLRRRLRRAAGTTWSYGRILGQRVAARDRGDPIDKPTQGTRMSVSVETCKELQDLVDRFRSHSPGPPAAASAQLVKELRNAIAEGQYEEAAAALRQATSPALDYTTAQSFCQIRKKLRHKVKLPQTIRLAIVGGFTTKQIASLVDLCLFSAGVDAEVYESDFGVFRQEIFDPASPLYAFQPEVVWLAVNRRDIGRKPSVAGDVAALEQLVSAEQTDWTNLWTTLQRHARCQIVQNDFVLPPWRSLRQSRDDATGSMGVTSPA